MKVEIALKILIILITLSVFAVNMNCIIHTSIVLSGYKRKVTPKLTLPYHLFPDKYIAQNYTIVDSRIPIPNCFFINDTVRPRIGSNVTIYESAYRTCFNFLHMKSTYYGLTSSFYTIDEVYYKPDDFAGKTCPMMVRARFDHVLGLAAQESWSFGDLINGMLIRLSQMPAEIVNKSVLPITQRTNPKFIKEILNIINTSNCRIVKCPKNQLIYAENLYTIMPTTKFVYTHLAFFGKIATKFGDICRKGFNTDIEPYEYVLYNRVPGKRRHFTNFDEIQKVVRELHPEHNFTTIIGHQSSLRLSANRYSRIKWLFSVCGSNNMNCLFMGMRTGVLMMMPSSYDDPAICCCLAREIFLVAYTNNKFKKNGPPFPLPLDDFIIYLNRSIEIFDQQYQ